MTKLKICGLMTERDVALVSGLGVDFLGFVSGYPQKTPWELEEAQAKKLIQAAPRGAACFLVTGGAPQAVIARARALQPSVLQLQYQETIEETDEIARALLPYGIRTVKALPVRPDGTSELEGYPNLKDAMEALAQTGVWAVLLDTRSPSAPDKSRTLHLAAYQRAMEAARLPVMVAGGITADNAGLIAKKLRPFALDVLSGSEQRPGEKDEDRIKALLHAMREK